jgi:dihydrofolate reductase
LNSAGGLVFGRVTYQMMASYWPTPAAIENDSEVAGLMNRLPKVVFSRTLDKAEWNNTKLLKGAERVAEEISDLKQPSGKDLLLFGSADLAATLTRLGLIDEYRLMVNPVVLGKGRPMFQDIDQKLDLRLLQTKTFQSGNVLLYYRPDRK